MRCLQLWCQPMGLLCLWQCFNSSFLLTQSWSLLLSFHQLSCTVLLSIVIQNLDLVKYILKRFQEALACFSKSCLVIPVVLIIVLFWKGHDDESLAFCALKENSRHIVVAESGYNIKPDIGGGHIERGGVEVSYIIIIIAHPVATWSFNCDLLFSSASLYSVHFSKAKNSEYKHWDVAYQQGY